MKKEIPVPIICTGLICVTALELYAMSQGINGWLLRIVVGIIAGVIGITIPLDKFIFIKK